MCSTADKPPHSAAWCGGPMPSTPTGILSPRNGRPRSHRAPASCKRSNGAAGAPDGATGGHGRVTLIRPYRSSGSPWRPGKALIQSLPLTAGGGRSPGLRNRVRGSNPLGALQKPLLSAFCRRGAGLASGKAPIRYQSYAWFAPGALCARDADAAGMKRTRLVS